MSGREQGNDVVWHFFGCSRYVNHLLSGLTIEKVRTAVGHLCRD